jgi:hypothetical protein
MMQPHRHYVSGLAWLSTSGTAGNLVTCSYDGSILMLDVEAARHLLVR